jgi:hypothetical protein
MATREPGRLPGCSSSTIDSQAETSSDRIGVERREPRRHHATDWDDPDLPARLARFAPDLLFVMHGRNLPSWGASQEATISRHGSELRGRRHGSSRASSIPSCE